LLSLPIQTDIHLAHRGLHLTQNVFGRYEIEDLPVMPRVGEDEEAAPERLFLIDIVGVQEPHG
jgi:hypothetical protein